MLVIQKLTGRVFGSAKGVGGNPVTIFMGIAAPLSDAFEQSLARSCQWESAFVFLPKEAEDDSSSSSSSHASSSFPQFKFYAPSGQKMSLCFHAAMGASYAVAKHYPNLITTPLETSSMAASTNNCSKVVSFQISNASDERVYGAHIQPDDTVLLDLPKVPYQQSRLPLENAESFLEQVGVDIAEISELPFNAGISGRMKSMIPLPLEVLQTKVKNPSFSKYFEDACLLSDNSTGLYLFSETSDDKEDIKDDNGDTIMATFECRQFPKKSGYPEDPATGIAAAALAVNTHRRRHLRMNLPNASFQFRQGTAMGRPSLITIRNIQYHEDDPNQTKKVQIVSLQCGGRVEIDDEETLTF